MFTEVDTIVLENNKEYYKVTEMVIDNVKYFILNGINDRSDFVIRKEVGEEIVGLDNEEEFNKVISVLIKKEN